MERGVSIIYANRNRDVSRIRHSLESLQKQTDKDFEVIFVDYGSEEQKLVEYEKLLQQYVYVSFFFLKVPQLLWNKSKALNYGIKQAAKSFVFIADVDLIFHPETVELFNSMVVKEKFFLFPLNYLSQAESKKVEDDYIFTDLVPERRGEVNGMILAATSALHAVWGLDEFFHFYGAEDEDLFGRLENAGYNKEFYDKEFFLHNWHASFSGSEDELLTTNPRVKNIMRINQRHFLRNIEEKRIRPTRQDSWGEVIPKELAEHLKSPSKTYKIKNILARVEHFLNEELVSLQGEIVEVIFYEDPYFKSNKHLVKKLLRKQTQPYCSMKEVNDMVLKTILFNYRDKNYSFRVGEDLKHIYFSIDL